ncbi:transcription factor domain-containing protein [Aspergillus stella-maris]|uniref:transcription factor domain-containing protein n=1 Tax=Aspergillus stella-maris TaxID=1810926 RepID=UPI003CCCCF4D
MLAYNPSRGIKRRRVNVACNPCRAHKIRCDGARPDCGTCLRRREKCAYSGSNEREVIDPSTAENTQPVPLLQALIPVGNEDEPEITAMGLAARLPNENDQSADDYFGDSSAVAFIKQLQENWRISGPDPGLPQHQMSAKSTHRKPVDDIAKCIVVPLDLLPARPLADHLVNCFFSKYHTLYPLVHKTAFLSVYQSMWAGGNGDPQDFRHPGIGLGDPTVSATTFYYALNIIFACGSLFSESLGEQRQSMSESFFSRCKPALDMDYLERGDLALVQVLVLMSHYLQGSPTPNRCWHVTGTASRMAQGIGLHSTVGDERRSFAQKQIRRRVWHGCVMLDQGASTMLGRPAMHSNSQSVPLPKAIDDCYLYPDLAICEQLPGTLCRVEWFIATLKLHQLLRKMSRPSTENASEQYTSKATEEKTTHSIDQVQSLTDIDLELESFRISVPKSIDFEIEVDDQPDQLLREKCLLKARFLYLRLLAYRPVLSQSLNRIRDTQISNTDRVCKIPDTGIYSNLALNCSVLCVQSAIDLVSLVNETCGTELASVWFYNVFYTFSAGLIVIIAEHHSQVLQLVTRESLDLAWVKCHSTLDYLKSINRLAERCSHTLNDTRARCAKFQSGFNSGDHNAPQTCTTSTTNVVAGQRESENDFEKLLTDIDFDNISLDWSLFDFDH